ncbi:MAG: hypothetical protein IJ830_05075 [Alphaproteobacteria bacterium]|nr:hypothetical protein [Alphaproteobacteria bacterium]
MENINVVMMFNDNYVIPGGVAILSLLKNSDPSYLYSLSILHNNITDEHQQKLKSIVKSFGNAQLKFINMHNRYQEFVLDLDYPKEILYKLCLPSIFKDCDKVIVTDVDVVFTGDVAQEYINFTTDEYFAGVKQIEYAYHPPFSTDLSDKNYHFTVGAGYMIYNLKSMRQDHIEQKCIDFLKKNIAYLKLPNQEVLCQVCYPKIKLLHPKNMTLTLWYVEKEYTFCYDYTARKEEIDEALNNPVQLHYVNPPPHYKYPQKWKKPWTDPFCPKAEIWYYWLAQTPFFEESFRTHLHLNEKTVRKKKKTLKQRLLKIVFPHIKS